MPFPLQIARCCYAQRHGCCHFPPRPVIQTYPTRLHHNRRAPSTTESRQKLARRPLGTAVTSIPPFVGSNFAPEPSRAHCRQVRCDMRRTFRAHLSRWRTPTGFDAHHTSRAGVRTFLLRRAETPRRPLASTRRAERVAAPARHTLNGRSQSQRRRRHHRHSF